MQASLMHRLLSEEQESRILGVRKNDRSFPHLSNHMKVLGQHQQEYSSQEENSSSLVVALVGEQQSGGVQQSGGEQQQPSRSTSISTSSTSRRIVVRRMESKVGVPCQAQQQHNDSQSGQSAGAPQAEGGSTKLSVLFSIFKKNNRNLTFQLNLETNMFVAASFAATMSRSHFYY